MRHVGAEILAVVLARAGSGLLELPELLLLVDLPLVMTRPANGFLLEEVDNRADPVADQLVNVSAVLTHDDDI
ncbi:hypothetical protein D9M70_633420 [compost metagenome]